MAANAAGAAGPGAALPPPLPAGWLVRASRSKGRVYYYHTRSNRTQWTRPSPDAPEDAPSSQTSATEHDRKRRRVEDATSDAHTTSAPTDARVKRQDELQALVATSMRVGGSSTTRGLKRPVAFTPWPHQLEAVTQVIAAIRSSPQRSEDTEERHKASSVQRFLLQHSTGAGKTLTIAALTHQLLYVKDALAQRFHTVVVMLDRVKLNEQVGDAVEQYLRRNGVHEVSRAESIEHLAKLLDASTPSSSPQRVIITTTHKMGLLVRDAVLLTRLLHRNTCNAKPSSGDVVDVACDETDAGYNAFQRVAIITDEAHRSHTSSTRDAIEQVMKAGEGSHAQLTFVGFTATPNAEALELFGSRTADGFLGPFHCYPIAQATADGRIMHALENYTCVRCEVETTIPEAVCNSLRQSHALRRVLDHASDDLAVLKAKTLMMMRDFQVVKRQHPQLKCMIVARSRLDVVRYFELVTTFVTKKQLGWNSYAAFSGTVTAADRGDNANQSPMNVTEQTLNHSHVTLAVSDVVVVCDKLDTGYNEPLLGCIYVDRYLHSSAKTVQLLSRLNRRHKSKPSVRVLDFANHAAQVRRSFADYWRDAKMAREADVDEALEQLDLATGITILCDHFPQLCATPVAVKNPRVFVEKHVLPLERDAFQQVLDALRGCVTACSKLESVGCHGIFDALSPFSHDLLVQLKRETETHLGSLDKDTEKELDAIKSKMAARVHQYHRAFVGSLSPQSLLDRSACGVELVKTIPCLLQFGPLEAFEAFLLLAAGRNRHEEPDMATMSQVLEAVGTALSSSVSSATSPDGEDRMSTRLGDMRKELSALVQHK